MAAHPPSVPILAALLLASAPAAAADFTPLASPSTAATTPPVWSGVHLGVDLGYAAGDSVAEEVDGAREYRARFDGAFGAVRLGWQRQTGLAVWGAELDAGYLGAEGSVTRDVAGGTLTSEASLGAFGALSARVGYLARPDLLLYGKAGVAVAANDGSTTQSCTTGTLCDGAQTTPESRAETDSPMWGILLGAGLEHRLDGHWSARMDYRYMRFDDELALPATDGPGWKHDSDIHAVSVGVSYNF